MKKHLFLPLFIPKKSLFMHLQQEVIKITYRSVGRKVEDET